MEGGRRGKRWWRAGGEGRDSGGREEGVRERKVRGRGER